MRDVGKKAMHVEYKVVGLFGAAFTILTCGCVLRPHVEFQNQYEKEVLGKSYTSTIEPLSVPKRLQSTTETGTSIVEVTVNSRCTVFYEIDHDIIVKAWDEGSRCVIAH